MNTGSTIYRAGIEDNYIIQASLHAAVTSDVHHGHVTQGPPDNKHRLKNIFHSCVEAETPEYLGHSSRDWPWHSICHHYSIFCLPAHRSYSCMNVSDRMKTDEDRWLTTY